MEKPDFPNNESARLDTIRFLNILDKPPEERFDRLTRMAKRMFRVSIALVSIVDENRQWFKSCYGLAMRETPRNISFCGHAILGNDIFVINDALTDHRFADNPLVIGHPHIRFYAGCPLRVADEIRIGTLCIIDDRPREFDAEDAAALRDLAAMVEDELSAFETATNDDLTKISNRRGFLPLAQHCLNLCTRQGMSASLVFIDLNRFKFINDMFGHAEGDRALVAFSDCMRTTFHSSDLFARLSGDEFVVLLTKTRKPEAEFVMRKLSTAINTYNINANRGYYLSFSYGIVEYQPETCMSIEELISQGDAEMYEIKRSLNSI